MWKESELYAMFNIMSMFFYFLESRSANKCLTCHEQNVQKSAISDWYLCFTTGSKFTLVVFQTENLHRISVKWLMGLIKKTTLIIC